MSPRDYTLRPMLLGFAAAVVIGVALALMVAFSRRMEQTLYPLLIFFQIVPKIAVAPLFIIWFGFGLFPKVLLVFLLSFFPVVVSAIKAFRSVDPDIMDLARTTGASRWRTFFKVEVPHAMPTLVHRHQGRGRLVRDRCRRRRIRRVRSRARQHAA